MDIPADQYELYAEFGMVAEKAQVLEVAAGNVALGFLMMFLNTDEITPEQTEIYRAIFDDVNRRTFGSLLKHVKKTMNLSDSIIKVIDEALERRNYLTHHFFRSHNFAVYSEKGRETMTAELKCRCSKIMSPLNCNETLSPYEDGDDESERVPTGESD